MYLERAEEEDRRMVENWKGDADGILVFTGLFSASVATFLGNTYQGLQLNSQDASAFYLSRIYQQSASDNGSQVPVPSTISDPAAFSPPTSTVWVNALWFLSLVISLTCALLATMLQQWARHYLRVTQTRYQPYKRARIRSFYAEGVEKFRVSWAIDALPALLHLSVFLFYAGLSVLLFTINLTIFKIVVSWVAFCLSLCVVITILPAVFANSPYRTPLTTLCWTALLYILRPLVNVLQHIFDSLSDKIRILESIYNALCDFGDGLQDLVSSGMLKLAERAAMSQSPDTDSRALAWTYDSLDEDHELEQFLAGIPGLLNSRTVDQPAVVLAQVDKLRHSGDLVGGALDLIFRPIGPSLSPQAAERRRLKICSDATFALILIHYPHSIPSWFHNESGFLLALEKMAKDPDQDLVVAANCMALLYFLSHPWANRFIWMIAPMSRIPGLPLFIDWDVWSDLEVRYAVGLHFIRHIALHCLEGSSRTAHAKAIATTLRHIHYHMRFVPESPHNEIQYSLCELWNRAVVTAPDRDEHKIALHILACLQPFYLHSHLQACTTTSEQFRCAETHDELIALKRFNFPPCAEASHCRPPTAYPSPPTSGRRRRFRGHRQGATSPQSARLPTLEPSPPASSRNPAIPMVLITPETGQTPDLGAASLSSPAVDLLLSVESSLQNNHSALPAAVSVPLDNVLRFSSPVEIDNLAGQAPSPHRSSSPDVNGLSTGSEVVITVDVGHAHDRSSRGNTSLLFRVPLSRVIRSPYDGWERLPTLLHAFI
ncbi:hypothetical protein BC834DRAFT_158793 [Gloeopeniophorella convolvens]|nr:hypothetical protein BC834DRAFT_158793 [Gloeopeniophorella convolvens]